MKLPAGVEVGVCSHTGLVRGANEDDYLVATLPLDGGGLIAAIADGMGGAAGGAEASRTALRALAATMLDADKISAGVVDSVSARMSSGFQSANVRVLESADAVPVLRDMGTTMTALWLGPSGGVLGHIGDTRLYRLRGDDYEVLTADHAVKEGESLLTRCIGGGQLVCDADYEEVEVQVGDRFVLCTDGVWNVVSSRDFVELAFCRGAQETAEKLVKSALDAGGPDNATVVVVDMASSGTSGAKEVDLPRHERPDARSLWPASVSLRPSVWSCLVLFVAVCLLIYSALKYFIIDR